MGRVRHWTRSVLQTGSSLPILISGHLIKLDHRTLCYRFFFIRIALWRNYDKLNKAKLFFYCIRFSEGRRKNNKCTMFYMWSRTDSDSNYADWPHLTIILKLDYVYQSCVVTILLSMGVILLAELALRISFILTWENMEILANHKVKM